MGLFSRRVPPSVFPPAVAPQVDLASALEIVLVKSVESQGQLASKISEMVVNQLETMTTLFARRLGQRGGRARAAQAKRNKTGQFLKKGNGCRLCANPGISNPTADEIRAHINHEDPNINYRIEGGAVHMDVDETQIQTDSQGNQTVECAECAQGVEHSHGRN
jgi:hypothetical protein